MSNSTRFSCTLHPLRVTPEEQAFVNELAEAFSAPVSQVMRANLLQLQHSRDPIKAIAAFL